MSTLKIKRENGKIFCPLADSWHIETPEEKVRQEYIKILVENYGYSLDQMAQEIKVNNSQRGQGKARADIVIWKSKQDKIESKAAFIVVECKAENVRIREEDYYQGYNYASWAGASFFVTTNEKETKYFNVDKDYLPKELVEVVAIPTAEEALNDKKVKDILSKTKTFTRDDFTKILRTCHNIIRNNDKLSPEAAFDEISKILFMKIKYLLDDECVESAKVMATVYTAIAAFENMVRQFVVKILMENKGENWWTECVSDKIRKSADSRKAEEDKIKWHTHRGTSMINYVDFADLANIMGQNYDLFEVHIVSLEWAKQIFTTLEKSRNVIMHSGELGERDIERIGINIRDWISQVGA